MPTLLIVDDEANMLYSLQKELRSDSLHVAIAETAEQGLDALAKESPDAVLIDVRLPDKSGMDLLSEIQAFDSQLPIIVMTAYSTTDLAINATQQGAYEFLTKPVPLHKLRAVVSKAVELRALNSLAAELEHEQLDAGQSDALVGNSSAMQHVYKQIGRVAQQRVNVLIQGESGTGKELCARSIHFYGCGADRPFVAVNASAIPETLLESELFGHEKGAFSGADLPRIGKFELANGGTLFLDEIGDMPLALQAKLLRSIQEGEFERVGGSKLIRSNVRFVAATNHDLDELIEAGSFRSDLYYRLNGYSISLPPLRNRITDLPCLVRYFIDRFNREMDCSVRGTEPGVLRMLSAHAWPGNVRELQNAIRHAFVSTTSDLLTLDSFPSSCTKAIDKNVGEGFHLESLIQSSLVSGDRSISRTIHDDVDRVLLNSVIAHCNGNRKAASELLGISRTTLLARLRALGINEPP